jgi:hypothetical protein
MPKPYTYPTLYNEVLQINISKLKEWEYLKPQQIKIGTINWTQSRNKRASISILSNTIEPKPFIELDYKYNNEVRKYKIHLVSIKSNLNKGNLMYFVCPKTNKRCRKLYLIGGYFLHREAFNRCFYQSQTKSKSFRTIEKVLMIYYGADEKFEELTKKHFKKTYSGKPTKRYLRLTKLIDKADNLTLTELEMLR